MFNNLSTEHFQLLKDVVFVSINQYEGFFITKSIFQNKMWDFAVPTLPFEQVDMGQLEEAIASYQSSAGSSIYISEDLKGTYEKPLETLGYENIFIDDFVAKEIKEANEVILGAEEVFEEITPETYSQYLNENKSAFPGWDNSENYTSAFYKMGRQKANKDLRTFILRNKKDIICFGSLIFSTDMNLAYMHNAGTNAKYRRQGYFIKSKFLMTNYLISHGITRVYALVEGGEASYKALTKIGFNLIKKYYIYSK